MCQYLVYDVVEIIVSSQFCIAASPIGQCLQQPVPRRVSGQSCLKGSQEFTVVQQVPANFIHHQFVNEFVPDCGFKFAVSRQVASLHRVKQCHQLWVQLSYGDGWVSSLVGIKVIPKACQFIYILFAYSGYGYFPINKLVDFRLQPPLLLPGST